eukprot:Skav234010  [mRNA]  locus=scaffold3484:86682:88380:- [translate_table: standard]
MQDAPPQEVTIVGDDWEERRHSVEVELDPDGVVSYWKKDKEELREGLERAWRGQDADPNVPGLYVSTIRIATNVEEEQQTQFQIVAGQDPKMTFHPSSRTPLKSAAVRGPEETKRENCWCVRGAKGERRSCRCFWYRVEFYRSETGAATVSWMIES